ncbi:MAG TPA: class I SAM-dependent methyltransferase [Rhizomicrobium sp.]|jgi:2-polyprenyl-3-methyl-5-hydroxy-6-metoxy-1,4-benzoquinol methylase|nr:class I SAM-dependent methyltransferase [Rhizomicrobium sp.]
MADAVSHPPCRACSAPLTESFVDLGMSPISNAMRRPDQADRPEKFYPLRAFVCSECRLVQLQDFCAADELFDDTYTYFSSYAESWLRHAKAYAGMMIERFALGANSRVIEVASNDGYLLQYFKERGIPVLGIDPAANVAAVAEKERGIPTRVCFFGVETAKALRSEGIRADVLAGNNVFAHVPDINDFAAGLKILLADNGVVTLEFPHLLRMIEANYFDTIYHEHYSYLSLLAVERLFKRHGLAVFDLEELETHGGSLRLFVGHAEKARGESDTLKTFRKRELDAGLASPQVYAAFADRVKRCKRELLKCLIGLKDQGKHVVAYGAPAKGNTLLNYCGIGRDIIDYAVDRSPHKQNMLLPGTGIAVHASERIFETKPDYVLILPWNLKTEIMASMAGISEWGGRFIVPLPEAEIL